MEENKNPWLKSTGDAFNTIQSQLPPPPHQNCARCNSNDTKFCYYNDYSFAQPRYYCKSCCRYWTHGGDLMNVPIGGGTRKNNKRRRDSCGPSLSSVVTRTNAAPPPPPFPPPPAPPILVQGQGLMPADFGTNNYVYPGGSLLSSLAAFQSINQPPIGSSSNSGRFGATMPVMQGVNFPAMSPYAPPLQFNTGHVPAQHGSELVHKDGSTNNLYGGRGDFESDTMVDEVDHLLNPTYSGDNVVQKHFGIGPSE